MPRLLVAVVATLLASVLVTAQHNSQPAAAHGESAADPKGNGIADIREFIEDPEARQRLVAAQSHTRALFGLDSAEATTERALTEQPLRRYGISASEDEHAVVTERLTAIGASDAVREAALQELGNEQFGGVWPDLALGRVVVASTNPADVDLEVLATRSGVDSALIEVVGVANSLTDLVQARTAVDQLMARKDSPIVGAATRLMDNTVDVTVVAGREPEAQRLLTGELDSATTLHSLDPDSFTDRRPRKHDVRGGDQLKVQQGGNWVSACSTGAWGYLVWSGLTIPFLVTADHCPDTLRHYSHIPNYETVTGDEDSDSQAMWGSWVEWTNNINVPGTDFQITTATSAGGAFDTVGHIVCKDGNTSSFTCGQIVSTDYDCPVYGVDDYRWSTAFSYFGDSGGTVFGWVYGSYNASMTGIVSTGPVCHPGEPFTDTVYPFQADILSGVGLHGWFTS